MPIELEISTASGRAQATASGSIKETRRPLLSGLNLSKSQVESALSRLHSGYRGPLMTVGEERWVSLDAGGCGPVALEIYWSGLCLAVDSYMLNDERTKMQMKLEITESGEARAKVLGSIKQHRLDFLSDLNLSRSQVEAALARLCCGYRAPLMTTAYTVEIESITQDIEDITNTLRKLTMANDTMRNHSDDSGTHSQEDITHTVSVTWSSSEQVTKGFDIDGELYIKGSSQLKFTATTGHEYCEEESDLVELPKEVSVMLSRLPQAGEAVRADLVVKRKTAKIRVPFCVKISGNVEAGYGPIEAPSKTFDLENLLMELGRPTSYNTDGIFEIVCVTDADITTVDF